MTSTSAPKNTQPAKVKSAALTPDITVVAALIYMMSSDGILSHEEISILQQSIGEDDQVIQRARAYIKNNKVDTFIHEANQFLDKPSKMYVLINVYDCMYSDEVAEKGEIKLFDKMMSGFGISERYFKPSAELIEFKNNKSILGQYNALDLSTEKHTPHKVLGSFLIYMMSADGSVSSQEIGQISSILGKYEGLQEYCATQAAKIKFEDYVNSVSPSLNENQKLYIATNFCDSMMSDGSAADEEMSLLNFILSKFNISEIAFKPYFDLIKNKNTYPLHALKVAANERGNLFKNQINKENEKGHSNVTVTTDSEQGIFNNTINDDQEGQLIKRTMDENINKAKKDLLNSENIETIQHNTEVTQSKGPVFSNEIKSEDAGIDNSSSANPNIAKINASGPEHNIQKVADLDSKKNLQNIDSGVSSDNIQSIDSGSSVDNIQSIDSSVASNNVQQLDQSMGGVNIQEIESSAFSPNKQLIDSGKNEANLQAIANQSISDNIQALENKKPIASNLLIDPRNKSSTGITIASDDDLINIEKLSPQQAIDENSQSLSSSSQTARNSTGSKDNTADRSVDIEGPTLQERNIPLPTEVTNQSNVGIETKETKENSFAKKAQLIESIKNITNAENVNRISKINNDLEDLLEKLQLVEQNGAAITVDDVVITKKRPPALNNKPRSNKAVIAQKADESNVVPIPDPAPVNKPPIVEKEKSTLNKVNLEQEAESQNTQRLGLQPVEPTNTVLLKTDEPLPSLQSDPATVLTLARQSLAAAKMNPMQSTEKISPTSPAMQATQATQATQVTLPTLSSPTKPIASDASNIIPALTPIASNSEPESSIPSLMSMTATTPSVAAILVDSSKPKTSTVHLIARKSSIRRQVINTVKVMCVASAFSLVSGFSGIGCDLVQCSWKQLEAPLSIEFQQYIYKTKDVLLTFFV